MEKILKKFNLNSLRLKYLLKLYDLSNDALINLLNTSLKRDHYSASDLEKIFNGEIEVDLVFLKRLDKIFGKGLVWYISDEKPSSSAESSIFLRKSNFESTLSLKDRKLINSFEDQKFELMYLSKLVNYNLDRKIPNYNITTNPKAIANEIRDKFQAIEKRLFLSKDNPRDFLKKIITVIEDYNVIVLEFIDNSKKEKINFEGIFLKPNIIVLKRQQKYLKREIFTLMHEFAHFLINNEEIDFDAENKINKDSHIEKWCNDFSYFFLAGNYDTELNKLQFANKSTNNFYDEEISSFCSNTYLSKSAYYTRLKIINKISDKDYSEILESIRESIQKENIERAILLEQEREMLKERGDKSFFTAPKPIRSKIVTDILRFNYASGNINQSDVSYFVRTTGDSIHDIID